MYTAMWWCLCFSIFDSTTSWDACFRILNVFVCMFFGAWHWTFLVYKSFWLQQLKITLMKSGAMSKTRKTKTMVWWGLDTKTSWLGFGKDLVYHFMECVRPVWKPNPSFDFKYLVSSAQTRPKPRQQLVGDLLTNVSAQSRLRSVFGRLLT